MINTTLEIQELIDLWIENIDVREKTKNQYNRIIRYFFKWIIERNINERTIANTHVIEYKKFVIDTNNETTARLYLIIVKMFYAWIYNNDYCTTHIAKDIKLPKFDNGFRRFPLTLEQAQQLMRTCNQKTPKGMRDYAIISLMLSSGLRRIEIIRLNIGDLSIQNNKNILWIQGKGKFEKQPIGIGENTLQAIQDYISNFNEIDDDQPLFRGTSGRNKYGRLHPDYLSHLIKKKLHEIGLGTAMNKRYYSCHSLRHTAATLLMQDNCDIYTIQKLLRHRNIQTSELYIRLISKTISFDNPHIKQLDKLLSIN